MRSLMLLGNLRIAKITFNIQILPTKVVLREVTHVKPYIPKPMQGKLLELWAYQKKKKNYITHCKIFFLFFKVWSN